MKPRKITIKAMLGQYDYSAFLVFALVFSAWELLSRISCIPANLFPPPTVIMCRFITLLSRDEQLVVNIGYSLGRLFIGSCCAVPLAFFLGVFAGLSVRFKRIVYPIVTITYPMPKVAILPLLMLFFGIGTLSKVILIAIGVFYFVFLNVMHSVQRLHQEYSDVIKIYNISLASKLYNVYLKGVLPHFLLGCKFGVAYGLVMVVISEFVAAQNGIGFFLWNAWDQFRIVDLYVSLSVLAIIGGLIFLVFDTGIYLVQTEQNDTTQKIFI